MIKVLEKTPLKIKLQCSLCLKYLWMTKAQYKTKGYVCPCEVVKLPIIELPVKVDRKTSK